MVNLRIGENFYEVGLIVAVMGLLRDQPVGFLLDA